MNVPIIDCNRSPKLSLFISNKNITPIDDDATISDEDRKVPAKNTKARKIYDALQQKKIFENQQEDISQLETLGDLFFKPGWACYPKQGRNAPFNKNTVCLLSKIFDRGAKDKCRKISAERVQVVVIEKIASRDWKERALISVSRIKAFFYE